MHDRRRSYRVWYVETGSAPNHSSASTETKKVVTPRRSEHGAAAQHRAAHDLSRADEVHLVRHRRGHDRTGATRLVRHGIAVAISMVLMAAGVTAARASFRARPPLAHTGGFGEPTCTECHFDGPSRPPEALSFGWVTPEHFRPGGVYRLEVAIQDTTARVGGFQLAVRVATGPRAGTQAGTLCAVDARVAVVADTTGVQYASHAGAALADSLRWQVEWRAPAEDVGAVVFHGAANSANDDDSPLGDAIIRDRGKFGQVPRLALDTRSHSGGYRTTSPRSSTSMSAVNAPPALEYGRETLRSNVPLRQRLDRQSGNRIHARRHHAPHRVQATAAEGKGIR